MIIRISGTPKLNFVRKIYWKLFSKMSLLLHVQQYQATIQKIENISEQKLKILYDPIIDIKKILKIKKN